MRAASAGSLLAWEPGQRFNHPNDISPESPNLASSRSVRLLLDRRKAGSQGLSPDDWLRLTAQNLVQRNGFAMTRETVRANRGGCSLIGTIAHLRAAVWSIT